MRWHQHFERAKPPPSNLLHLGNCIDVMGRMPVASVDFILTDPPYLANYKDRSGRSIENDTGDAWLNPAYAAMFRILKRDGFAISFYGWPKLDRFFAAWESAGFRVGGHIVFRKKYTSKSAFLQYQHEQAYLLIKGRPPYPPTRLRMSLICLIPVTSCILHKSQYLRSNTSLPHFHSQATQFSIHLQDPVRLYSPRVNSAGNTSA